MSGIPPDSISLPRNLNQVPMQMKLKFLSTILVLYVTGIASLSYEDHSIRHKFSPREASENGGRFVAFFEEKLGRTLYKFVPDNEAPESLVMRPEVSMARIVTRLKTFLQNDTYEYDQFELDADRIEKELADIGELIEKQNPVQPEIKYQLRFTLRMFHEMVDAIEPLRHFEGRKDYRMVGQMIDFNVRLYNMYNSEGTLDKSLTGYSDDIFRYGILLNFWEREFSEIEKVPIGVRSAFKKVLLKTEQTLSALRKQIS